MSFSQDNRCQASFPGKVIKMKISQFCLLLVVICFSPVKVVLPQELRLFEETESNTSIRDDTVRGGTRRDSDGNVITGPEFTLVGTTRIGNNFLVVIEDRSGDTISVRVGESTSAAIPGYSEFRVLSMRSGRVSIEYPSSVPCVEFEEQGITCATPQVASLSLTNAQPIESANQDTTFVGNQNTGASSQEENIANPFEAILQRASNPDSVEETENNFTPRRINPENVPSGMRIVSTPFGDRLVEIDQ